MPNKTIKKATVVNVHLEPYDVCIMRPSLFSNPYRIGPDGSRDEVIEKFRSYYYNRAHTDTAFLGAAAKIKRQATWLLLQAVAVPR